MDRPAKGLPGPTIGGVSLVHGHGPTPPPLPRGLLQAAGQRLGTPTLPGKLPSPGPRNSEAASQPPGLSVQGDSGTSCVEECRPLHWAQTHLV